jgi:Uma2 family endonuclease
MTAGVQTLISTEDYFEMEYASETRHEFIDGEIRAMPYTTENHQLIITNLLTVLGSFFITRKEKVLSSDRLLFVEACSAAYYPDVTIFPANIEYKPYRGKMMAALNPPVIIEVLSESTAHIDRGAKLHCYKTISSLKQYLLISQDEKRVEVYNRHNGSDEWLYTDFVRDEQTVNIGGCAVSIKDIYRKVAFETAKKA